MKISIDRTAKTPIYLQICGQIEKLILKGILSDGCMLPSERRLAEQLRVHRNTVTKAYCELRSEGLISSSQGRAYRVDFRNSSTAAETEKAVNWEALMRQEYDGFDSDFDELYSRSFEPGTISFAGGVAAREPYPPEEITSVFGNILDSSRGKAYFYVPYQGDPELRQEIAGYLATKGIRVSPADIQIFSENNQGLDFILSLMLSPGDSVVADETISADVHRTIELAGGRIITVPSDGDGMVCDGLETIIEKQKPKFIYVDSSFNNPTGMILPLERRKKILELSYRYRIPVIEDDEGSELYYGNEQLPSIKSMDKGGNVIYMYSFSLTMIPGIGVSFVAADRKIIEQFANMVSLRIANPDWAAQMLMLEYMKNGIFAERLNDFRAVCRRKRDIMCERLDRLAVRYGLEYRKPEGGVYLWIRLPGTVNARELLKETRKRGMTFMPGYVFYSRKSLGRNYLRLNFSYPTEAEIREGMNIFEEAVDAMLR